MINKALNAQHVLITRPEHKQQALGALLALHGATVEKLAVIKIQPFKPGDKDYALAKQHILNLDLFDIVICISANAGRMAGELIDQYWPQLPIGIKWLAMGKATTVALSKYDIDAEIMPGHSDSEALLLNPKLSHIQAKKILILKGNSGRELLSQTLQSRGAIICEANLYNRLIPVYTDTHIKSVLYSHHFSAILITSAEAVSNLTTIARGSLEQFSIKALLDTPLVVPSSRVANVAAALGYHHITVAPAADNQAMLSALLSVKILEDDHEEKN